jgi:hypothetical protein
MSDQQPAVGVREYDMPTERRLALPLYNRRGGGGRQYQRSLERKRTTWNVECRLKLSWYHGDARFGELPMSTYRLLHGLCFACAAWLSACSGHGGDSVASLSTPGTPSPSSEPEVRAECQAEAEHETNLCPNLYSDVPFWTDQCVLDWKRQDAAGCGAANRALVVCRTSATIDCATGEDTACGAYQEARTKCRSAFVSRTNCVVAGEPETLCAGGLGTYSYGCMGSVAPFKNCKPSTPEQSGVDFYCCY